MSQQFAYMSPDTFCETHRALLRKGLPNLADLPIVNGLLAEAKAKGMTWMEGLEFAVEQRNRMTAEAAEARRASR